LPDQFQIERTPARESNEVCAGAPEVFFEFAAARGREGEFERVPARVAAHVQAERFRAAAIERIE
jgi:hypothetical protein